MTIIEAELYAFYKHIKQTRKYTGEPYFNHLKNVALKVESWGGSSEQIQAAYLHDVVEDQDATIQGISLSFGVSVAKLVWWLTDTPNLAGNRSTRKHMDALRLSMAPVDAKIIKCADLIDNTSSIVKHDRKFARKYIEEKYNIIKHFSDVPDNIFLEVHASLNKAREELND